MFSNKKPLLLKLAIYPTDERISFTDMRHFRGNIFECIDEAVRYVTNNIHWNAKIVGMERIETPKIPIEAFCTRHDSDGEQILLDTSSYFAAIEMVFDDSYRAVDWIFRYGHLLLNLRGTLRMYLI